MSSKPEIRAWEDEDIDERVEELRSHVASSKWSLPRPHNIVIYDPVDGHLAVLHTTVVLQMLATIEKLRQK